MPDSVAAMISTCLGVASLCALSVAIPQAVLLARLVRVRDPIGAYTLKTVLWTGSLGVVFGWQFLLWVDYARFGRRYFGALDDHWPVDATLAVLLVLACVYAAVLYHATVTFGRDAA